VRGKHWGVVVPTTAKQKPHVKRGAKYKGVDSRLRGNDNVGPFGPGKLFIAENYPETVGIMTALKAGVALSSVQRPLAETNVSLERYKLYGQEFLKVDDAPVIADKYTLQGSKFPRVKS